MEAPMEQFRLKLKVGPHEFEAEGDQESVERQLAIWRDLIASTPTASSPPPAPAPSSSTPTPASPAVSGGSSVSQQEREMYGKIFRVESDGHLTLSVLPTGATKEADAALLLLLGQRIYNNEELVTGNPLMVGLARSGMPVPRVDRVFGDYMDQYVIRVGTHRAVRYRLTGIGWNKVREMANELI